MDLDFQKSGIFREQMCLSVWNLLQLEWTEEPFWPLWRYAESLVLYLLFPGSADSMNGLDQMLIHKKTFLLSLNIVGKFRNADQICASASSVSHLTLIVFNASQANWQVRLWLHIHQQNQPWMVSLAPSTMSCHWRRATCPSLYALLDSSILNPPSTKSG